MSPQQSIAHYRIVSRLGEGGMGAVYRATDTKLGRDVAIKILPERFAEDPDRLARFEREAKVLASLNHPNIAHVYGVEESNAVRALVMELVPGATLSSPLPLAVALGYGRQIADALEAAHDKGITHRDLKPANIVVTPEGVVKVLDFGLATAPVREGDNDRVNSPTLTLAATQAGMILGTAAYMSPEQAAGRPVDRRADIWSFGVVFYEMLVGKPLFEGETTSHTLADVLRAPIDLSSLPRETPHAIRSLLKHCLNRDVRKRLRDIGDARLVIEEVLSGPEKEDDTRAASARFPKALAAATGVLAAALAGLALIHFREQPPAAELVRFPVAAPVGNKLYRGMMGYNSLLAISPDGRLLAFTALAADNRRAIWIRSLEDPEARLVAGTGGVTDMFWSPDSHFLAFVADGALKKVNVSGGPAQTICAAPGAMAGGSWAAGGAILFATFGSLLTKVSSSGGKPEPFTGLGTALRPGMQAASPVFLPDGRHFLYTQFVRGPSAEIDVNLASLDARPGEQPPGRLMTIESPNLVYAPSPDPRRGYILFLRENNLMAQPFDTERLKLSGVPVPVAGGVASAGSGVISASHTGVLAYRTGSSGLDSRLTWFDRQGKELGHIGPAAPYANLSLSPDGKIVLADYLVHGAFDRLSRADTIRGIFSRLNPGEITDYSGISSPDGRVAFLYGPTGAKGDIYLKAANGAGVAEPLVRNDYLKHPNDWSHDGRYLIYDEHTAQKQDLWVIPMAGDRKPIPFLVTPADETDAAFSPDVHWVAYSSDESGRREVYVQGFLPGQNPSAGIGKWAISADGGSKPKWRRDGKELYYLSPTGNLMAVAVKSTATTFEPSIAVDLFETHPRGYSPYDVAPDGRFLINTVIEDAGVTPPIMVVLNWTAGVRR